MTRPNRGCCMCIPFVRATQIAHEVSAVSYNHFARQRYRIHRIPAHQRWLRCVCFAGVRQIIGQMRRSADRTVQIQDTQYRDTQYDGCMPPLDHQWRACRKISRVRFQGVERCNRVRRRADPSRHHWIAACRWAIAQLALHPTRNRLWLSLPKLRYRAGSTPASH